MDEQGWHVAVYKKRSRSSPMISLLGPAVGASDVEIVGVWSEASFSKK